jgi:hypothetical protein
MEYDISESKPLPVLVLVSACLIAVPSITSAQKIICWKDKTGKVVGCGDRVPPEYQGTESKQLDKTGRTVKTTVSAEESARQRKEAEEKAAREAEDKRRQAEQARQDMALINTYTSATEIDQRRDRELQVIELQLKQLNASLKSAEETYGTQKKRFDAAGKSGKPVPANVADDYKRATEDRDKAAKRVADKQKDRSDVTQRYDAQKKRFLELRASSGTSSAPNTKK